MCEGADHRRITRMDAAGTVTAIAERWHGKRFNKPNDIVCRSDGSIFFTDPELRLPPAQREIGFSGVFRIDPQGQVHLATDACEYPNGLAFSPDESILYVAISRLDERCFQEEARGEVCPHRRIRAFDVAPDGTLSHNRVFCEMASAAPGVPDGLKVDTAGRVWCVGSGGIWVDRALWRGHRDRPDARGGAQPGLWRAGLSYLVSDAWWVPRHTRGHHTRDWGAECVSHPGRSSSLLRAGPNPPRWVPKNKVERSGLAVGDVLHRHRQVRIEEPVGGIGWLARKIRAAS